jgi:hypothetical protein
VEGTTGRADLERVERWFLARGLPHFIDRYSASRDVFTRALPVLTLILVLELVGALNSAWPWWVNVLVGVASFAALLGVWALANAARKRRLLAPPDRVGPTELGVFLVVPAALALLAGGQRLTALNTLAGNLVLLGLIYLVTSYGLLPMTRWAAGRLWHQLGDLVGLIVRALPLLLLFVVFLFLTGEVWQVAASLDGPFLAVVAALFVALGVAFVVGRIPSEIGAVARFDSWGEVAGLAAGTPAEALTARAEPTPLDPPPLSRRQWGNVGLVVLFSQGVQVVLVTLLIGLFLVAFGLAAITPATAGAWVGGEVDVLVEAEVWGRPVALTVELLQVAGLLAAVSGFSFTLSLLTDSAYRREFLEDLLGEVREAFAVRAIYLACLARRQG